MSFASRFPNVARLLSSTASAGAAADDKETTGNGGQGTSDDKETTDDGKAPAGASGSSAGASTTNVGQLQSAFETDAQKLVADERTRCVNVFTSEAGKRNPEAAGRLLSKSGMSAEDIIDTLDTVGSSAGQPDADKDPRAQHRERINGDKDAKPNTGGAEEQPEGGKGAAAREKHKQRMEERNKATEKKGAVRANRRD